MKPTIGRIVLFGLKSYTIEGEDGKYLQAPAIITKVHTDELVNLTVFLDSGLEYKTSVPFGDGEPNTWIWPPRV